MTTKNLKLDWWSSLMAIESGSPPCRQGTSAWGRCTQRVNPCVREWAPWPALHPLLHVPKLGVCRGEHVEHTQGPRMISVWMSHDITYGKDTCADPLANLTHYSFSITNMWSAANALINRVLVRDYCDKSRCSSWLLLYTRERSCKQPSKIIKHVCDVYLPDKQWVMMQDAVWSSAFLNGKKMDD